MSSSPRGIRNNNPTNIRISKTPWQGKLGGAGNTDGAFEQFSTPVMGIRAGAVNALTHYHRGADTVRKIIDIQSPPNENNTEAYIEHVAVACGLAKDGNDLLDLTDEGNMYNFIAAVIVEENGPAVVSEGAYSATLWYSPAVVHQAVTMAIG